MHMVSLSLRDQGHGDAGALTGSAIQITEALQAGRKRLRSCQWTVNTGGLSKLRTLWPLSGLPSGRAPRSFSSRAAERCIDLDPQWSPSEGGSPPHTLVPGREETTAFPPQEFLKLLVRSVGSSTTDTTCSTAILTHFKISDEVLSHMSISSPVPSLIFLTLCHVLSNAADMLRVRMREEALVLVPSFGVAAACTLTFSSVVYSTWKCGGVAVWRCGGGESGVKLWARGAPMRCGTCPTGQRPPPPHPHLLRFAQKYNMISFG